MKKKGFTLIELMISLAIFSIFAGFMYRSFYEEIRASKTMNYRIDLQYNAGKAMDLITTEVRNGGKITFDGTGKKLVGTVPVAVTTLIDLSGTGSGSDLNLDTTGKSLKDNDGRILCKNIDSVQLTITGDMIKISIDLSEGKESYKAVTGINLKDTNG